MNESLPLSQFTYLFPDDDSCLEEIRKLKYPGGIVCSQCKGVTRHYKIEGRTAYACKFCRSQVYPLTGTIFEKTTTPLRLWFYAMFLMTHTRAGISAKVLQRELGVTYKTAWRMHKRIFVLMAKNDGDLVNEIWNREGARVHQWVFFNKIHLTMVEKQEATK